MEVLDRNKRNRPHDPHDRQTFVCRDNTSGLWVSVPDRALKLSHGQLKKEMRLAAAQREIDQYFRKIDCKANLSYTPSTQNFQEVTPLTPHLHATWEVQATPALQELTEIRRNAFQKDPSQDVSENAPKIKWLSALFSEQSDQEMQDPEKIPMQAYLPEIPTAEEQQWIKGNVEILQFSVMVRQGEGKSTEFSVIEVQGLYSVPKTMYRVVTHTGTNATSTKSIRSCASLRSVCQLYTWLYNAAERDGYFKGAFAVCAVGSDQLQRECLLTKSSDTSLPAAVQTLVSDIYEETRARLKSSLHADITAQGIKTALGSIGAGQVEKAEMLLEQLWQLRQGEDGKLEVSEARLTRQNAIKKQLFATIPHTSQHAFDADSLSDMHVDRKK